MGSADDVDEGIESAVGLLPQLLPEREIAGDCVVVVELVAPPPSGFVGDLPARAIIALISASVICPRSLGTSSTTAPNAFIVRRFSSLNASENTMCSP